MAKLWLSTWRCGELCLTASQRLAGPKRIEQPINLRGLPGKVCRVMQADQQVALLPHFSREERSIKVAFERVRGVEYVGADRQQRAVPSASAARNGGKAQVAGVVSLHRTFLSPLAPSWLRLPASPPPAYPSSPVWRQLTGQLRPSPADSFGEPTRCCLPAPPVAAQALQWLRHGCIPVIVVEGRAPEEKRGAQQQRWVQDCGLAVDETPFLSLGWDERMWVKCTCVCFWQGRGQGSGRVW